MESTVDAISQFGVHESEVQEEVIRFGARMSQKYMSTGEGRVTQNCTDAYQTMHAKEGIYRCMPDLDVLYIVNKSC
jgi:hypothetical protein